MITTQQAEAARDRGMSWAEVNANKDHHQWSEDAMSAVMMYCTAHPDSEFLTEDVRDFCESLDLAETPKNGKAWGPIMRKAATLGIVRKVGYGLARSSNCSPKVLWMAA